MSSNISFIAIPMAPRNIQIAIKPAVVHISQAAKDIIISVIFHSGAKHSGPIVNPFIKIAEGRSRTYAYSFGDYSATVTLPLHSRVSC